MKPKNTLIITIIIIIFLVIISIIFGKTFFSKRLNIRNMSQKITDEIFVNILAHGFVWKNELIEEDLYSSEEGKFILSSKIDALLAEYDITEKDVLAYEDMLTEKFENDPEYYENVTEKFEKRVTELENNS